jgi:hypothetical protein
MSAYSGPEGSCETAMGDSNQTSNCVSSNVIQTYLHQVFHPKMPHESMLINLCEAAAADESHDLVDIMGVVVDYSLRRRRQGGSDPTTSAAVWIVDDSFPDFAGPAVVSIRGQFLSLLLTCSRQSAGEMPWAVGDIVRFNQVRKTTADDQQLHFEYPWADPNPLPWVRLGHYDVDIVSDNRAQSPRLEANVRQLTTWFRASPFTSPTSWNRHIMPCQYRSCSELAAMCLAGPQDKVYSHVTCYVVDFISSPPHPPRPQRYKRGKQLPQHRSGVGTWAILADAVSWRAQSATPSQHSQGGCCTLLVPKKWQDCLRQCYEERTLIAISHVSCRRPNDSEVGLNLSIDQDSVVLIPTARTSIQPVPMPTAREVSKQVPQAGQLSHVTAFIHDIVFLPAGGETSQEPVSMRELYHDAGGDNDRLFRALAQAAVFRESSLEPGSNRPRYRCLAVTLGPRDEQQLRVTINCPHVLARLYGDLSPSDWDDGDNMPLLCRLVVSLLSTLWRDHVPLSWTLLPNEDWPTDQSLAHTPTVADVRLLEMVK